MKKRILLLTILALILSACFVLSSCDNSNTDEGKEPSSSSSQKYVTVTFDTNGGSAIDSVQVIKGEKVAKPQDPQKEGYTLDGWYIDGEKWSFAGYTVTENMTLTAKWTPITYTITYAGDVTHSNKTTYTVEDEFELLNGEGKTYYEFLGWYEDEEFTKQVTKIEKGTVGNKTLYAKTEYIPVVLEIDGDSYKVVGCDKKTASVVIPSTYKGKNVTSIGDYAFAYCESLTSVIIPNSVTSIGNGAFYNCTSLTSIEIPNSITSIGNGVFYCCTSLTSITIPNSVTSIGNSAFSGCTRLTIYCEATSKPSGWDGYWNYSNCPVVWNCNNNDVANDGYIYTVIDGVRYSIKDGAATVATQPRNIKEAIIKESITYKNVSYPVTSIGAFAFYDCTSLTSVSIPNSVTSIGGDAFRGCTGLTSVTIPNSVTSIGNYAFYNCTSLTIYCEAESQPSGWAGYWNHSKCPVVWGYKQGE